MHPAVLQPVCFLPSIDALCAAFSDMLGCHPRGCECPTRCSEQAQLAQALVYCHVWLMLSPAVTLRQGMKAEMLCVCSASNQDHVAPHAQEVCPHLHDDLTPLRISSTHVDSGLGCSCYVDHAAQRGHSFLVTVHHADALQAACMALPSRPL